MSIKTSFHTKISYSSHSNNPINKGMVICMAQKRKILMLVENLPVPSDNRVWSEATTLRDHGFQVSIISPKGSTRDQESHVCIDGIHIYRYQLLPADSKSTAYLLEYTISMLMTFLLSLKVLFRHGFDVIHAANPPDTFFLIGLFYRPFGKKFVYDQHDLSPEMFRVKFKGRMRPLHKLMLFLEWCSYRTADVVVTPNLAVKRFALQRGHCRPERVFVVYNGPNLTRIKEVPAEPELKRGRRYLLAYVGTMEVQDGVEYTLLALHELVQRYGRRDVSLVLMGDGGNAPTLHALANELQLEAYVQFTGWMKSADIVRYLSVADVGLTPKPKNGLSEYCTMVKTLEYMALGKPVIGFDLDEMRLSAQDAMLYAEPNHAADFANKIETLLNDEELRRTIGANGRRRILEELNWDRTKVNLMLAYKVLFPRLFSLSDDL
jgi:glycosyltransferase involved in cell wall biosynthesis